MDKGKATLITFRSTTPMPQAYRCVVRSSLFGYTGAAVSTGNYFVLMNEPGLPFIGGGWPNPATPLATTGCGAFDQLLNDRFYTNYVCLSSRLRVEFLPVADGDNIIVTITPSSDSLKPNSVKTAMSQPWTVTSTAKHNVATNLTTLQSSMRISKIVGVPDAFIQNDLSGKFIGNTASPPAALYYYMVNWATANSQNLGDVLEYRIFVEYDVEFRNFSSANVTET